MNHDECESRRNAPYPGKDPAEAEALRFLKSWHRAPELHELLWYKGVNLGETAEYDLFTDILPLFIEREQRIARERRRDAPE